MKNTDLNILENLYNNISKLLIHINMIEISSKKNLSKEINSIFYRVNNLEILKYSCYIDYNTSSEIYLILTTSYLYIYNDNKQLTKVDTNSFLNSIRALTDQYSLEELEKIYYDIEK